MHVDVRSTCLRRGRIRGEISETAILRSSMEGVWSGKLPAKLQGGMIKSSSDLDALFFLLDEVMFEIVTIII